eukprot:CAMPEP_0202867288 /NCGR_PEP_ID=MMETSP1391-20130828/9101_1 /ASSEMBLY_ACC=CAM_ASM_000867 /TAXON_ID=1034604 /ORGANISM="Chlamydomonas leiostraca, Strain SAG 11-49" /LENGTH=416 /DNA_ID=CAMNT_0049547319 /DNA_START=82 /DNA_END=1333 /DNA_ORIENTATION=+
MAAQTGITSHPMDHARAQCITHYRTLFDLSRTYLTPLSHMLTIAPTGSPQLPCHPAPAENPPLQPHSLEVQTQGTSAPCYTTTPLQPQHAARAATVLVPLLRSSAQQPQVIAHPRARKHVRALHAQALLEVLHHAAQALAQRHLGLPPQRALDLGDVGLALAGVVRRVLAEHNLRLGVDHLLDQVGQLQHRELAGVAHVEGARVRPLHHGDHAVDEVADVLEGARLRAVAVHGQRLAGQRLRHKVGHHAPVVQRHARAVRVEDADDAHVGAVLAPVVHGQRLGDTLALVVAGALADAVDVAPVRLLLGVLQRVAVHLAGGGDEEASLAALCHAQHVQGAQEGCLGSLDGVPLVVHRGGWARQVIDLVDFQLDRLRDIVTDELKVRLVQKMCNVVLAASEEVVHADHIVPLAHEEVT